MSSLDLIKDTYMTATKMQLASLGITTNQENQVVPKGDYEPGDDLVVHRNQGNRDAIVLAVLGDQALVEYEMPAGTTALILGKNKRGELEWGKSLSYRNVPRKWIQAIRNGYGCWEGNSQTGEVPFPENNDA